MLAWNNLQTFKMIDLCREVIDTLSEQFGRMLGVFKDQTGVVGELAERVVGKDKPPSKKR